VLFGLQEQQELQLSRQQLEAECRTAKQQLAEAQAVAAAARTVADSAHDNLRSIMLQLNLAAQSLADVHKDHEQQQQQLQQHGWEQPQQWQLSRVQQLYLQIVHELAVLPKIEEQPAAGLNSSVPVMLRLPRLMARVALTEQQLHQEQQVGLALIRHED
jgi:DNA repair exonuclease SbcCD ATPase subunit